MPLKENTGNISPWLVILILAAVISGFYVSTWLFSSDQQPAMPDYRALKLYPQPKPLKNISLTDKDGKTLTEGSLQGNWTLVFFGYTHCPDVCPTTLADMRVLTERISQDGVTPPQILFVSVDPERDQPDQLKNWIEFFNPQFQAATGTPEAIENIARQMGVAYFIGDHEPGDNNYTVDHTAAIFLLDPQSRLYGLFTSPHKLPDMASDLIALTKKKSTGSDA